MQFTERAIRSLCKQILQGLASCHAIGVVHRDIKPDNILLIRPEPDSPLRIVDFGFAKQRPLELGGRFDSSLGSPMYKAPEVWDSTGRKTRGYTVKVDVWSAGVLFFVMLSGQYPFDCEPSHRDCDPLEHVRLQKQLLKRAVLTGSLRFDEDVWASVSPEARKLVTSMLVVDAAARPSAQDCLEHVWFAGESTHAIDLATARHNLVGFNARRKLRAALFAVRTATGARPRPVRGSSSTSVDAPSPQSAIDPIEAATSAASIAGAAGAVRQAKQDPDAANASATSRSGSTASDKCA